MESEKKWTIPVFNPSENAEFTPLDDDYNPFAPSSENRPGNAVAGQNQTPHPSYNGIKASGLNDRKASAFADWEKLYTGFHSGDNDNLLNDISEQDIKPSALNTTPSDLDIYVPGTPSAPTLPETETTESAGILQLRNKYLIVPSRNGLMIIDRHRAHVKVLFERYAAMTKLSSGESQQIMFPETLTLSPAQHVTLEGMLSDLKILGFDLSYLGDKVWAVNAMPASASKLNPIDTLLKMIENVAEGTVQPGADMHHNVTLSMAKAAAVQPGQQLSQAEAEALLSDFFSLPDPAYTPDGHPTFFTLDAAEIAKRL